MMTVYDFTIREEVVILKKENILPIKGEIIIKILTE